MFRILTLLLLIGLAIKSHPATTNSITQWGITWQFSNDCTYGTFANGDYWVVSPVTVTNMTPVWDGTNNGWEINPTYQVYQGFSSNDNSSSTYTNTLMVPLPFTINSNASLVKTIGGIKGSSFSTISNAAVLTILTSAPPNNGVEVFRPPYVGTNKPLYLVSNLRQDILPSYHPVGTPLTLENVRSNFSLCLRMDHTTVPRWLRPFSAMNDYQPENTANLNESMLTLMLNDSFSNKLPALIQFTQHAIDQAHVIMLGYRRSDDGHNPNHRVLAAWAGVMLNDPVILAYMASATGFHEDNYLYNGINGPLWGESNSELNYWNYIMGLGGSKSNKDPYDYIDGGSLITGAASYQNITSQSLKGQALIFKLFSNLKSCIPSSRLVTLSGYANRWVTHGTWSLPDPAAPYDGVPANYGVTFGPNGGGSYIAGSGRFTAANGQYRDGGQYKSLFVSNMWYAYWTSSELTIKGKAKFLGKATIR